MNKQIDSKLLAILKEKIAKIDELENSYDKDSFDQWHGETSMILEHIFGEKSEKVRTFNSYDGSLGVFWPSESSSDRMERYRKSYFSDLKSAKNFLTGLFLFFEKILPEEKIPQETSIKNINTADSIGYSLHPIISNVSGPLYADGHYRDAIRSAFIEVIDRVKELSGRQPNGNGKGEMDGADLMNHVFANKNGLPKLRWSELKTMPEKDFHNGITFLFKGLVGLRNEKGHVNVEQKDKDKAFEYLTFASLLMRQLDEAVVEKKKPAIGYIPSDSEE